MTTDSSALPVALLVAIAAGVEVLGGGGAMATLVDLALIAVVVAASERRHAAMFMATGIACGLAPFGAMLLPLAIGIAVQRRVRASALLLTPAMAAGTMLAMGGLPLSDARASMGLWAILPDPGLYGLLVAIALGTLGWLTATLTARALPGRDLALAATIAALAFAFVSPQVSMAVPVALGMLVRDRRIAALATAAAVMAALAHPALATIALTTALILAARRFLRPAANDNPVFAAA